MEKYYVCTVCPVECKSQGKMDRHFRREHQTIKRNCRRCGREFRYSRSLKQHLLKDVCNSWLVTDYEPIEQIILDKKRETKPGDILLETETEMTDKYDRFRDNSNEFWEPDMGYRSDSPKLWLHFPAGDGPAIELCSKWDMEEGESKKKKTTERPATISDPTVLPPISFLYNSTPNSVTRVSNPDLTIGEAYQNNILGWQWLESMVRYLLICYYGFCTKN